MFRARADFKRHKEEVRSVLVVPEASRARDRAQPLKVMRHLGEIEVSG